MAKSLPPREGTGMKVYPEQRSGVKSEPQGKREAEGDQKSRPCAVCGEPVRSGDTQISIHGLNVHVPCAAYRRRRYR
jgi:hypothetical protein